MRYVIGDREQTTYSKSFALKRNSEVRLGDKGLRRVF